MEVHGEPERGAITLWLPRLPRSAITQSPRWGFGAQELFGQGSERIIPARSCTWGIADKFTRSQWTYLTQVSSELKELAVRKRVVTVLLRLDNRARNIRGLVQASEFCNKCRCHEPMVSRNAVRC